jgi:YcaO-like protein with predicted kinase domain
MAFPTMCAVVPRSHDAVSVYNGRGATREHALLGAVMEAVERQTAAACILPERALRVDRVKRGINLSRCGLRRGFEHEALPFVRGWDLLTGEPLDVPKALVQVPWRGPAAFPTTHTNGLAARFNRTEAIYHALLELVERHLYAVTHARAHLRPKRLLHEIFGEVVLPFVDDPVAEIEVPTGNEDVDELCERLASSGFTVRLIAMHAPPLPLGVTAVIRDKETPYRYHGGLGCSWSAVEASIRAITEAAQARVADVQAARENILRAADPASRFLGNTRRRARIAHGRWYFDGPTAPVTLRQFPNESVEDVRDGLGRLIEALGTIASRIAIVDLSPCERDFSVVRAIVPELETTLIDGRVGPIAQAIIDGG